MVEFENELMIASYRIPWLIWIQLLVTILLILLLFFGLTVCTSDPSASASAGGGSPATGCSIASPIHLNKSTSSNRIIMVEEQRVGRNESNREDDRQSREVLATKDSMIWSIFRRPNHPCNYLELAKRALFKCFGLDSSSGELDQSST